MVKPGKKVRPGGNSFIWRWTFIAKVFSIEEDGTRIVEFYYDGIFEEILDRLGEMPLPPYIKEKLRG